MVLPASAECGRKGIAVKPKRGDCLLFWSLKPDSKTTDKFSLHAGCPVIKGALSDAALACALAVAAFVTACTARPAFVIAPGDKWSATKWIRVNEHKTY